MTLRERATALRELADNLEAVAELEADHHAAKLAYAADMTPENKAAHRLATDALTVARTAMRNSPVRDVETNGMSMTIIPPTVG